MTARSARNSSVIHPHGIGLECLMVSTFDGSLYTSMLEGSTVTFLTRRLYRLSRMRRLWRALVVQQDNRLDELTPNQIKSDHIYLFQ